MNRFEINFSLNDVNMTIDTRTDESDSKEEVALAVKTAIASRLFEYETFDAMNDDEIDKLIDIKSLSEVEKKKFRIEATKKMTVELTVDAYDEDTARDEARDEISYGNVDDEWYEDSEIDYIEEVEEKLVA